MYLVYGSTEYNKEIHAVIGAMYQLDDAVVTGIFKILGHVLEESSNKEAIELRVPSGYAAVATSKALRSPCCLDLPLRNNCHK